MRILGVETSCDETAAAVLADGAIISSVVLSQDGLHAPYGGVVPELASRRHLEVVLPVVARALADAHLTLPDLDGIAVTLGTEIEVLQETIAPSDGGIRYTREVRFDARPDDIRVWIFDIASDGTIRFGAFQSKGDFDRQKARADSAAQPSN